MSPRTGAGATGKITSSIFARRGVGGISSARGLRIGLVTELGPGEAEGPGEELEVLPCERIVGRRRRAEEADDGVARSPNGKQLSEVLEAYVHGSPRREHHRGNGPSGTLTCELAHPLDWNDPVHEGNVWPRSRVARGFRAIPSPGGRL